MITICAPGQSATMSHLLAITTRTFVVAFGHLASTECEYVTTGRRDRKMMLKQRTEITLFVKAVDILWIIIFILFLAIRLR